MLIKEKVAQAVQILNEYDLDCWLTFVRESGMVRDPMLDFLIRTNVTWHSAFVIHRSGATTAIVGQLDRQAIEDLGVYSRVLSYVQGIRESLLALLREMDPRTIAVNYSTGSEVCDGLTHGMFLTLQAMLSEVGFAGRVQSAERVCSSLRARKTSWEIDRMRTAIAHTQEIFGMAKNFIRPGKSEREIADFMSAEVERRGLGFGWDRSHCPSVFTGPATAGAHYQPTDRLVQRGHVLNMDFGVRFEDYVSDLQRTFYVLEEGENVPPDSVQKGFNTVAAAIELARRAIRPGIQGVEVDRVARDYIVAQGFEEYPHGLGHQVGRFAHDGTALLGPPWEKYAQKPFEPIEEDMVFTLEPRLTVADRGIVTIEEMVRVTSDGSEYLSDPQKELILI